jgi:hypothetical protein
MGYACRVRGSHHHNVVESGVAVALASKEGQMIEGLVPQIALAAIILGSWGSVIMHGRTPWRASLMGKHLMAYMLILALWYTELGIASFITGTPIVMQGVEAITFLCIPFVVWWRLALQWWWRPRGKRKLPSTTKRSDGGSGDGEPPGSST